MKQKRASDEESKAGSELSNKKKIEAKISNVVQKNHPTVRLDCKIETRKPKMASQKRRSYNTIQTQPIYGHREKEERLNTWIKKCDYIKKNSRKGVREDLKGSYQRFLHENVE